MMMIRNNARVPLPSAMLIVKLPQQNKPPSILDPHPALSFFTLTKRGLSFWTVYGSSRQFGQGNQLTWIRRRFAALAHVWYSACRESATNQQADVIRTAQSLTGQGLVALDLPIRTRDSNSGRNTVYLKRCLRLIQHHLC
jgi:hypothetical protein